MEMVYTSLFFIAAVIFTFLIGLFIEKTLKRKGLLVELKHSIQNNVLWIVTFILLFLPISYGYQRIFQFFRFAESSLFTFSFVVSVCTLAFLFNYISKKLRRIESLENIIRVAAANDIGFEKKFRLSHPNNYVPGRDVARSLILEKIGLLRDFLDFSGPTTMDNYYDRSILGRKAKELEMINDILGEFRTRSRINWELVYDDLKTLDKIILHSLPKKLIGKFDRKIYFVRLNLFDMILPYILKNEYLILDEATAENEILSDYLKMVLNNFYQLHSRWKRRAMPEYQIQKENYNLKRFTEYLRESE